MAWAQRSYNELMGDPRKGKPLKYRIATVGCRLTSDCNLLERFGRGISPIALNAAYRDRGLYTDIDDGVFDDIVNTTITRFDPNIVLTGSGTGKPPHDNCIVKLPLKNNQFGTHFSLVHHIDGSGIYITDSWDGQIRNANYYGALIRWDAYEDRTPRPASPPAPIPQPPGIRYERVQEMELIVNKAPTEHWDLNFTAWGTARSAASIDFGTVFVTNGKAYHPLGGVYYMRNTDFGDADTNGGFPIHNVGINDHDLSPKPLPAVVAPIPVEPAPEPVDPDAWKYVIDVTVAGKYESIKDPYIDVVDLEGIHVTLRLPFNNKVTIHSGFTGPDGRKYLRTKRWVDADVFYGIPQDALLFIVDPVDDDSTFEYDKQEKVGIVKKITSSVSSVVAWATSFIVGFKKGKEPKQ